ncbi:hypothetical protein [Marinagarivorans cellulosilyticus]|uniref:Cytochrome c domain-containing protein n=1 Tax=Marinagarivorans cellulosilyticus TaxID=2721545 RepID=A0AAN2BJA8_9GAMM|nr:hypothetical protein [Marinagarivorans cellulosilyticus]BCD96736.1 hypothetical protein MARGE09_P0936 [Marinagarivorans cellulosilyticus]
MFHSLRKLAFISPVTLTLALASGCDVSNGTGPGKEQQPDPVVVDIPIAFIARVIPIDDDPDALGMAVSQNILDPAAFNPGARLILKDRAKYSATETDITSGLFPDRLEDPDDEDSNLVPAQIDIKDLESSPDGEKLLFSLRAPADPNDDNPQPTWNLWEYSLETGVAAPLLDSVIAEQGEDVSPHYLPDGRIVFSSTRQKRTKAILLDEGKAQYSGLDESAEAHAFNLHVFDPRNDDIEQLTFNPSHDVQPTLLANGRIAFLRWDNMPDHNQVSFYSIKPDGSDIQKLYGYNSQTTGPNGSEATFWNAREINDGELLINFRNRASRHWGGDIVAINTNGFTDLNQSNPQNPGSGSPQKPLSLIPINITENNPDVYSIGGFYNSAYPLNDGTNRLLVSWSPCLINALSEGKTYSCTDAFLAKANIQPATPSFGLWVLNLDLGTQQPLKPVTPEDNEVYTEAIALSIQPRADNIISNLDSNLAEEGVGLVHIRNIYDIDGNMSLNVAPMPHLANRSERPERFIRIVKAVPIPDEDALDFNRNIAFGENGENFMRDILGYVPIEPDGSAKFKIPANMAIALNLVDANGKRLPDALHENWFNVQPGEHFECIGCHQSGSLQPHSRRDAQESSAYLGAPFIGIELIDQNGTPVPAPQTGQTMAEHFADELGVRTPAIDMLYRDIWTQNSSNLEADISLAYASIAPNGTDTLPPANDSCSTPLEGVSWEQPTTCLSSANPSPFAQPTWSSGCRITINYEQHIQPLWQRDRRTCDPQPNPDGSDNVLSDNTCINCHSNDNQSADGMPLAPAASLYLTQTMPVINVPNDPDPNAVSQNNGCDQNRSDDFYASYRQLLVSRLSLELVDGELRPVYTSAYQDDTNEDGEPILNSDGSVRQRVVRTCTQLDAPANAGNAFNSVGFFSIFEGNDPIHTGILSPSERRLIAEWLDLGGQYYNDPFVAPLND